MVSRRRPSLASVLSHARPLEVCGKRVCLALEPGSFFADQMRDSRNRRDMERFCQEFFGDQTELVIQEQNAEKAQDNIPSLAETRQQARIEAEQLMRKRALDDPRVQEAIRIFGAEVHEIRPEGREDL